MPSLSLLADMNISPQTVADLQQAGWQAVRVSTVLAHNSTDADILVWARQAGYVIVTQDLDFSNLLALGGYAKLSLITLRLGDTAPAIVSQRLLTALPQVENELEKGCAVTVTDTTVRIRPLPIQ